MKNKKIAICYDFDGTLSPDNMQEVSFIPSLAMKVSDFWDKANQDAKDNNMDSVIAYLNLMIDKAKEKGISMSKGDLKRHGKDVRLFCGVETWFDRINEYGKSKGVEIEHYIISSGVQEIIQGTKIADKFKHIFACSFVYNNGNAEKPATAVNYTNKTQHLFRINKGIFNYYQNDELNSYTPLEEKYIHFKNMIYIGDGETDVPCMKMVMYQGGYAIAVYNPEKTGDRNHKSAKQIATELYSHDRADFIAPTDYKEGSEIEEIVRNIIDEISVKMKSEEIKSKINKSIEE